MPVNKKLRISINSTVAVIVPVQLPVGQIL